MKTLAIALLAGAGLGGCVAVPAYGPSPYGGQAYGAPVIVAPAFRFGFGYGGGGYYGNRGYGYYGNRGYYGGRY